LAFCAKELILKRKTVGFRGLEEALIIMSVVGFQFSSFATNHYVPRIIYAIGLLCERWNRITHWVKWLPVSWKTELCSPQRRGVPSLPPTLYIYLFRSSSLLSNWYRGAFSPDEIWRREKQTTPLHLVVQPWKPWALPLILLHIYLVLSDNLILCARHGVWIDNLIYWMLITLNYK
jgi:hypothetical protein